MDKKLLNIAVVGATGVVGRQILNVLHERNFPHNNIFALASDNSQYDKVNFGDDIEIKIEKLSKFDFSKVDIVFSAISSKLTKEYIKSAIKCNCFIIDNSSYHRLTHQLIIPEINGTELNKNSLKKSRIIASPNCIAIPLALILKPLSENIGKIKRVVISTYQAVAGSGLKGMRELMTQTKNNVMGSKKLENKHFIREIAFNLFPQIGDINDKTGITSEEEKITNETKKLIEKDIEINVTSVRVPVFVGHCASVNIEFDNNVDLNQIHSILKKSKGLKVFPINKLVKSTPIDVTETDSIMVSRLRTDKTVKNGINLWFASNCLRKGAALNTVQIAEKLITIIGEK